MKTKLVILLLVLGLTAFACGQFEIGIETQTPPPPATEAPLPTQQTQSENNSVRDDAEKPDFSEYWKVVQDPRTDLAFAIPCYWTANFPLPEQDPTGFGSVSVNNFTQEFITSLGPKRGQTVWEIGGLKFDLGYHQMSQYGLDKNASIDQLAYALVNPDEEHGINALTPIEVDGKSGIRVETWSQFGEGGFYLLPYTGDLYILFGPGPEGAADHPDLQAILNSLDLSQDGEVVLPTHRPADPPAGMAVSCMPTLESTEPDTLPDPVTEISSAPLDCATVTDQDPLMWVICNVKDSFISRNTQPLYGYMHDPFKIGYWQSEGVTLSRDEAFNQLAAMPVDSPEMTFTMDQSQFPPLFGTPPENMFGPEDKPNAIVYCEGWGEDGQGAALLYFKLMPDGNYRFYAMVIAQNHFDK